MPHYDVNVGNIGTVYCGDNFAEAEEAYNLYLFRSQQNIGRASGEQVTLFCDGDIHSEYTPDSYGEDA